MRAANAIRKSRWFSIVSFGGRLLRVSTGISMVGSQLVLAAQMFTMGAVAAAAAFIPVSSGLPASEGTSGMWCDLNNDGFLDVVLVGVSRVPNGVLFSEVFLSNHDGTFSSANANIRPAQNMQPLIADFDNDSDLDIFLGAGVATTNLNALLYVNDGQGHFRMTPTAVLQSSFSASSADYDSDGRMDVCLTTYGGGTNTLEVFRNLGGTNFARFLVLSNYVGGIDSGDYDRDGLPDLLLAGQINDLGYDSLVFRNLGNWRFTNTAANLGPGIWGSCRWGDVNNNGRLDALFSGIYFGTNPRTIGFATQQADGTFLGGAALGLPPIAGQVAWGDFDNDGLLDFVVAGTTNQINQGLFAKVYRNNQNLPPAEFVEAANLTGINTFQEDGWAGWADYDNDGDLDLIVSGRAEAAVGTKPFTQLYRNDSPVKNTAPSAPIELQAVVSGTEVRLEWGPAFDAQTPTPGLTYNIRVGTKPGGVEVVSPMSRPDGWRMVVQRGNADHRLFSKVIGLKGGIYYWSVQAVDTAFAGGPFAPEATFVVPPAIQGIALQSDGTVRLSMLGAPNVAGYVVEGSTNLTSWTGVATLAADANGQFSYVETNVGTIPARYYRVHSP